MSTQFRPPTFSETVLRPFFARETYLGLAYALLGLPLGTFYFVFLVTGLSVGLGLAVTVVGIPILVLIVVAARGLAQLERTLAVSLLGASMPRVAKERGAGVLWRRLAGQARSGATWRELAYLLIRFPTGVASFSIAVSVVGAGGYAIVAPIVIASGVRGAEFGSWRIDSVSEALLLVPPGIVLLFLAPLILTLQARLERALVVHFLGRVPRADFRRAVGHTLARGDADAFSLMADLELYFGPGPHLSATRLEATLLGLQDLGLVVSARSGPVDRYSLTAAGRTALARA
jgi:hypothetical protein